MEGWQRRSREEREFLSCRFREARALVQRLAQENQSLLGQLNHSISPCVGTSKEAGTQGQDQELKCTNAEKNVPMDSPEVNSFVNQLFIYKELEICQFIELKLTSLFCFITQVLNEAVLTDRAEGDTDRHTMPQSLVIYHKSQYEKCSNVFVCCCISTM